MTMPYWMMLGIVSLIFAMLEFAWPWRKQSQLRQGLVTDLIYVVFNGHFLALLVAPVASRITPSVDSILVPVLGKAHVMNWPIWGQFLLAFFLVDFIQWGIHRLLHRVPFLWNIHKVHHSISEMDWIGSMRFHWFEIVVYRSLQYVPMLLLGFRWEVLAWLAVFSTVMGHLNHANLKISMGPLRYFLNHPTMHIWHHDMKLHGRYGCNFGINLSLWDWIFGTAYMPKDANQPDNLGFPGLLKFPRGFLFQQLLPWKRRR